MAPCELLTLRQEMREMTTPGGRVLARSKTLGLLRIEHGFDPRAQSLRRFGRRRPDRPQDCEFRFDAGRRSDLMPATIPK